MSPNAAVACFSLMAFLGTNLAAEEISIPLPKDGAWARYHVTTTHDTDALNETSTRSETIRFVGTVVSQDRRARWLEQEFSGFEAGKKNVMKTLVAEEDLKSAWLLADRRRWWHKETDQPVNEVETLGPEYGVFSLVFPGPYSTAKPLKESRIVEYQRGRFEIQEGLTGRQEISLQTIDYDMAFAMDYTVWRHPDVPLGLAAAKISFRTREAGRLNPRGTYTTEFVLEDFGTNAKTTLPEQN